MSDTTQNPNDSIIKMHADAAAEWLSFKAEFIAAMKTVKAAREGLKHSANIAKAQGLSNGLNSVFENWS